MNILGCLVPFLQWVAKQRVAIINPHMWRGKNPGGSQNFIQFQVSCVSATFVFLCYTYSPTNLWDLLTWRHLNQCFGPFKDHFDSVFSVGLDFSENKQKHSIPTLKGELLFYFSHRPPITVHLCNIKQFWPAVRACHSAPMCYYSMWWSVCLFEWACLNVDYKDLKAGENVEMVVCSLSGEWDKRNSGLSHYLLISVSTYNYPLPTFTNRPISLNNMHPWPLTF